jgi:hypothetical protein
MQVKGRRPRYTRYDEKGYAELITEQAWELREHGVDEKTALAQANEIAAMYRHHFRIWKEPMDKGALMERCLLLERTCSAVKEELERFLKKKSGYKELRELLKKIPPARHRSRLPARASQWRPGSGEAGGLELSSREVL